MRGSLTWKLIAAFLGVSLFAIALVTLVSAVVTANEFDRFVSQDAQANFAAFASDYYRAHESLHGFDQAVFERVQSDFASENDAPHLVPFVMTNARGVVVNPGERYMLGQTVPFETLGTGTVVVVDGTAVGFILPRQERAPSNRAQTEYMRRTVTTLVYASLGTALGAVLVGIWLARTITRPLRDLTGAARSLAKGEFGQTVRVTSHDEVGALAQAFNQMSMDLHRADEARRQMTADIAHELRNPLAVIGGYLDAMRSGDLQPTPKRLNAVHEEIQHLEDIVQDLRTLSLADANVLSLNRTVIAPHELIERVVARFSPQAIQKSISLEMDAGRDLPQLLGDEARLLQVLDNLVSNALRYTPRGGVIRVTAARQPETMRFAVSDTGTGIAEQDPSRVFERFYRADKARTGEENSSGLGLAIARAIVNAHGGRIWVESKPGHGATFIFELPLAA